MNRKVLTIGSLGIGVLVTLYALAGFLLVPYGIERQLPGYVAERLNGRLALGPVEFNPFLLRLTARELQLTDAEGAPLLSIPRLVADLDWSSLFRQAWIFSLVRLEQPGLQIERNADGGTRLDGLLKQRDPGNQTEVRRGPPTITVHQVDLIGGSIQLSDDIGGKAETLTIESIDLSLANLSTTSEEGGLYTLQGSLQRGGALSWAGRFTLSPLGSEGVLRVKQLPIVDIWRAMQESAVLAPPTGVVDLEATYRFAWHERMFTLEKARIDLTDLTLAKPASPESPLLRLASAVVVGGRVDLQSREISFSTTALRDGEARIVIGSDGAVNWQGLVRASPARTAVSSAMPAKQPWHYALGALTLERFAFGLVDQSLASAPITYDVEVIAARITNIGADQAKPIVFEAGLRVGEHGRVNASGTLVQDLQQATAKVSLVDVPLAPLAPLLAAHAALDLRKGSLSAEGTLDYRGGDASPSWTGTGSIALGDTLVTEAGTNERFLSWRLLKADAVRYASAPAQLVIGTIVVEEPGAKLVIARDRKVNVMQVWRGGSTAKTTSQTPHTAAMKAADGGGSRSDAATGTGWAFRIDQIRLTKGVLDFADDSLVLPFKTRIQSLNGALTGVSNDPGARARLRAEGRIEPYGLARARGTIAVTAPARHTDIHTEFQNVLMPPLSPYSATFAGRRIEAGKLWLALHYRIEGRQLAGSNDVRVDDLRLGERVDAPNALDLPLDLAIALLTDERGRINVAVPVRGDLDNPQFSYGTVIREALVQVVQRVISAPFRLLGRLVGLHGDAQLDTIDFEPGRARLRPPEQEKLNNVAVALGERTQLKLIVPAPFNALRDASALARQRVRSALGERLGVKGEGAAGIAFGSARTQRALEDMLAARADAKAIESLVREHEQKSGRPVERLGRVGGFFGRASEDTGFYVAVLRRLAELEPASIDALHALARERAEVIVDYLVRSAGVDRTRIEIGPPQATADDQAPAVSARLSLDLTRARTERAEGPS